MISGNSVEEENKNNNMQQVAQSHNNNNNNNNSSSSNNNNNNSNNNNNNNSIENGGISNSRSKRASSRGESSLSSSARLSGSWQKKLVFGIPILSSLSEKDTQPLPPAIDACLQYIEEKALDTNYLFLLRDNSEKLRKAIEEGTEVDFNTYSPHTICNLVLYYLEALPVPLITPEVYKTLISCDPGMIWRIAIILEKLPLEHYYLLKRICNILKDVADNSHRNGASVDDLVNTIEPIITRAPNVSEASDLLISVNRSKEMVKSLIINSREIFSHATTVPVFGDGEKVVLRIEDVNCAHNTGCEEPNTKFYNGVMWITNYQITWKSVERENTNERRTANVRIPNRSVASLETFKPRGKNISIKAVHTGIHVKCHNFRFESFILPGQKCKQVYELLSTLCFSSERESFALENSETFARTEGGWKAYKRKAEFTRLGFSNNWRISTANKIYDLCCIYPKTIIIPAAVADISLSNCSRNRDLSRVPIAVWRHPANFAVLLRSGPTTNEGARDEDTAGMQLIESVLTNVRLERQSSEELTNLPCCIEVADCGAAAGSCYKCIQTIWNAELPSVQRLQWNFQTLQVHVMHSLYINDQWEKQVLQSGYLSHVRALLSAAKKMAQMLNSGTCVVTQSSIKDGYDLLECALVSLALVLLDPYYRTTHGFIVLIEKEWNQFAFPFHPTKVTEGKHIRKVELAPVFILFLDCVWQIYKEMPAAFQFNERFLIFLADQSIFSRFGTFLFGIDRNSIQDSNDTALHAQRLEHERIIKTGAVSAWDYVSFHKEKFVNVLYAPYCTFLAGTHLVRVQLWQAYFLRYTTSANKMDFWRQVNHLRATNGENLYLQALKLPNMMELETSALRLFHDVKSIDLSSNFLNCYPVELLLSTKLSKLNLQKNRLKAFPPSAFVAHMTDLLELILATNQIDALPPMVTMFSSLTILKLGSNKIENIEHLGVLTSLIHLDLSENCIVSVPNNVSALQSLQELLLSKNMLSTFPENISSMTSLRELSLSFNRFSTVPSGIYQLTSLQALELQKNKIESLSNDLLKLQYLRVLNFSENRISTFPHALCSLDSLGRLDLGRNELTSLPPNISRMTNLVQLILDGNKISEIPLEIGALMSLTELNLHDNLLTEIPPSIGQLMSLRTLELRGNAINYLPHTVGLLSHTLRHFAVDACAVAHLPQPILARGADEILRYMQEYMQLDKISYTTKMVLLGNEDSGKTSLMNSLLKKFKKSSECCATAPTPGINVESWKFNLRDSSADTVNVHVWDLGGQERYRTAHQLLLPQACVNIIAWNVLQGTSLDYFESAIEYWIRFLCARIVDARPIIFIVATHIDHPNAPRNRKAILHDILIRYKEMFPGFDIYSASVGCTTGQGISDLRKDIQTVIYAKLMQNKPIPTSWQLLERTLITERAKRNIPIMNGSELGRLCQACGMENPRGIRRALWWLHNNSNFCFLEPLDGPSLENVPVAVNSHGIAILDPQWLCANFSTIFSARRSWSINKGYDELGEIWKFPESDANVPQLLATAATFFLDFQMTKLQQFDVID